MSTLNHVLAQPVFTPSEVTSPIWDGASPSIKPMGGKEQRPTYYEALMRQYSVPTELIDLLEAHRKAGNWEQLCECISVYIDWMHVTFVAYYDIIPVEYRYDFLIECHVYGGDKLAAVRREMKKIKSLREPVFPVELDGVDVITVYRAGDEPIEKAPYCLSWTISKEKAEWFMHYSGYHKLSSMHLYEGTIARNKVLVYTNRREEKEIIQYGSVKNIREIGYLSYEEIFGIDK